MRAQYDRDHLGEFGKPFQGVLKGFVVGLRELRLEGLLQVLMLQELGG